MAETNVETDVALAKSDVRHLEDSLKEFRNTYKDDMRELKDSIKELKDSYKDSFGKGDNRMDCHDLQIQALEQTLYGDKSKSKPGLVDQVTKNTDDIKDLTIKAAVLGIVAGILGYLGITNLGWLGQVLSPK